MTVPDYIKEVKERLGRSIPRPWKITPAKGCDDWTLHNRELIARAPEDLVKLIRIVEVIEKWSPLMSEWAFVSEHSDKYLGPKVRKYTVLAMEFQLREIKKAMDKIARGEG